MMMEKKFTNNDIDQYFEQFKAMTKRYPIEKVMDLLDNPPSPKPVGTSLIQSLKIPIIVAFIASGIIVIYFAIDQKRDQIVDQEVNRPEATAASPGFVGPEADDKDKSVALPSRPEQDQSDKQLMAVEEKTAVSPTSSLEKPVHFVEKEESSDDSQSMPSSVEPCNWPTDTTLDGSNLLLELRDYQLEDIGFLVDKSGIYYANEFNAKKIYFHSRRDKRGGEITRLIDLKNQKNKKDELSNFDFYPVAITDIFYSQISTHEIDFDEFQFQNDTLVPVIVKAEIANYSEDDLIIWFLPTESFFEQLPEYQHMSAVYYCLKQLKQDRVQSDVVKYHRKSLIEGVQVIDADPEMLRKMDIEVNSDYSIEYSENNGLCSFDIYLSPSSQSVHLNQHIANKPLSKFRLVFISDENGRQSIRWNCKREKAKSLSDTYDLLIPIKITSSAFALQNEEDLILWFEPSDALFEAMTPKVGDQIKEEFESIKSGMMGGEATSTTCTYFEVCKSNLAVDEMKVFPNPASDRLNITFRLNEDNPSTGSIILLNTNGSAVKTLSDNAEFIGGMNAFKFDLEGLQSGIYILKIASSKGFLTRRVIVEQ